MVWLFPAQPVKNGIVLNNAERQKAEQYSEAVASDLVSLVTLGCETGGCWNSAAIKRLDKLVHYGSKDVPALLRCLVELS